MQEMKSPELQAECSIGLCATCSKIVKNSDFAIACGVKNEEPCHWNHISCLEKDHLLNGKIVVPITAILYEFLKTVEFSFFCHNCSSHPPLPFQLVEQNLLSFSDFVKYDIATPELNPFLLQSYVKMQQSPSSVSNPEESEKKVVVPSAQVAVSESLLSDVVVVPNTSPENSMGLVQSMMLLVRSQLEQTRLEREREREVREIEREERRLERERLEEKDKRDKEFFEKMFARLESNSALSSAATSSKDSSFTSAHGVASNQVTNGSSSHGFLKLPKIQIPIFKGDILEWPSFWDCFNEMVHRHDRFSNIEKMSFLLNHLSENVKKVVQNITLESKNYPDVVQILRDRYENLYEIRSSHIRALMSLERISGMNVVSLRSFLDTVEGHARGLLKLESDDVDRLDLQMCFCVQSLFEKLPLFLREKMIETAGIDVREKLSLFRKTLGERLKILESIQISAFLKSPVVENVGHLKKPKLTAGSGLLTVSGSQGMTPSHQKTPKIFCSFCKVENSHRSFECKKFPTVEDRMKSLGTNTCHLCFKKGHRKPDCKTKGKYACKNCGATNHNSALCFKLFEKPKGAESTVLTVDKSSNQQSSSESGDAIDLSALCSLDEDTAMSTFVVKMHNPETGDEIKVRGILDSASKRTYICQRVAQALHLTPKKRIRRKICIFGSQQPTELCSGLCEFEIVGRDKKFIGFSGNIVEKEITGTILLNEIPLSSEDSQTIQKLTLADPEFADSRSFQIDLLIGNDYFPMLLMNGKKQLKKSGVFMQNTRLGWVSGGIIQGSTLSSSDYGNLALFANESFSSIKFEEKKSSEFSVEDFWSLESIGIQDSTEPEDDVAWKKFHDTVIIENSRVSVQWITKPCISDLPSNFSVALYRLKSLLKNMVSKPDYWEKYQKVFSDQFCKGVIEKVTPDMNKGFQTHYIPHHAVITPDKKTTKLRVVYDASARLNKKALNLNQCLFRGPNLLGDLCSILLRFRIFLVAIIADIEKAFLQIELQESARDITRFLWLKDTSVLSVENNLQIMRFCRVPFGFKTSPFLLMGSIWFLLDKVCEKDQFFAEKIRQNLYMDNLVVSVTDEKKAKEFYVTAKQIFSDAKMNLREWSSNSSEFCSFLPENDYAKESVVKVLGMHWFRQSDSFGFSDIDRLVFVSADTKRKILGCVASIFDPLGLLSCIKILGMIFLQTVWKAKVDWDTVLSTELLDQWKAVSSTLLTISSITVPRLVCSDASNSRIDLLCFCDASAEAFASLVYLRSENSERVLVNLIFAKSRLTPAKRMTIPRAELLAVLIGTRCLKFVQKSLQLKFESVCLWTDSQIVLGWLKRETHSQGVFVSNRVCEILDNPDIKFGFVSSEENPADLASKSRSPGYNMNWELWWHGPSWLLNTCSEWPTFECLDKSLVIKDSEHLLLAGEGTECVKFLKFEKIVLENVFDVLSFRFFMKFIRVVAWCLHFLKNLCEKVSKRRQNAVGHMMQLRSQKTHKLSLQYLSSEEVLKAQQFIIKCIQIKAYPDLFTEKIERSNFAQMLCVFVADDGLLRCRGRFGNAELTLGEKMPILLPSKSKITSLIVLSSHRILFHAGVSHTLAHVRHEFWIPKGRIVVQKATKGCRMCMKLKAKPFRPPPMPDLPKERCIRAPAFTYTGLDYFGPLFCKKKNKSQKKVWGVLFTCMVVRAVHLELVSDMSSEVFLCALRRFSARRGKPSIIFSDNAAQFKAVQRLLKHSERIEFQENQPPAAIPHFSDHIQWRFIPEVSPWMGGFYERLVGVTKSALKKVLGRNVLNVEQLSTLFTEVEAVVNSRPLSYVSMKNSDLDVEVITPQHFLAAGSTDNLPILQGDDPLDPEYLQKISTANNIMQKWKVAQYYLNSFWKQWRDNYLLSLRERHASEKFPHKKSQTFRPPVVGELVLVHNVNAPRSQWKLGKIIHVNQSKDKQIRSADVLVAGSKNVITRPVSALYPLELSISDVQKEN